MAQLIYWMQLLLYYLHWGVYWLYQSLLMIAGVMIMGFRFVLRGIQPIRHSIGLPFTSPIPPDTLPIGHQIQNIYTIEKLLGQGGFGQAYLARNHHQWDHPCVIKEFRPACIQDLPDPQQLAKAWDLFKREAYILSQLNHPQIPQFRGFFSEIIDRQPHWLLVQDWVNGQTLSHGIRKNWFKEENDVVQFLRYMLPVIKYLHDQGIYHRDIAPDNIILSDDTGLPHLIDFGGVKIAIEPVIVSKGKLPHQTQRQGQPLTLLYKPGYSPLEQMQGQFYPTSDLYALGVTAIAMITGSTNPETLRDSYHQWHWQQHRKFSVSPSLAQVLDRMVAPHPSQRYPSAQAVYQALDQAFRLGPMPPVPAPAAPLGSLPQPYSPPSPAPAYTQVTVAALGSPSTTVVGNPTAQRGSTRVAPGIMSRSLTRITQNFTQPPQPPTHPNTLSLAPRSLEEAHPTTLSQGLRRRWLGRLGWVLVGLGVVFVPLIVSYWIVRLLQR